MDSPFTLHCPSWNLNITDAPLGMFEAAIVDRDPAGNLTLLALQLVSEDTEGGELSFTGAFDSMPPGGPFAKVADLTQRMHIGHIHLQLTTEEGVFDSEADGDAYFTEEDEEMEWEGTGDAPTPAGAEPSHEHGEEGEHEHGEAEEHEHADGAAHSHRRQLRAA